MSKYEKEFGNLFLLERLIKRNGKILKMIGVNPDKWLDLYKGFLNVTVIAEKGSIPEAIQLNGQLHGFSFEDSVERYRSCYNETIREGFLPAYGVKFGNVATVVEGVNAIPNFLFRRKKNRLGWKGWPYGAVLIDHKKVENLIALLRAENLIALLRAGIFPHDMEIEIRNYLGLDVFKDNPERFNYFNEILLKELESIFRLQERTFQCFDPSIDDGDFVMIRLKSERGVFLDDLDGAVNYAWVNSILKPGLPRATAIADLDRFFAIIPQVIDDWEKLVTVMEQIYYPLKRDGSNSLPFWSIPIVNSAYDKISVRTVEVRREGRGNLYVYIPVIDEKNSFIKIRLEDFCEKMREASIRFDEGDNLYGFPGNPSFQGPEYLFLYLGFPCVAIDDGFLTPNLIKIIEFIKRNNGGIGNFVSPFDFKQIERYNSV